MSKSNSFSILQTLIARGYVADEGEGMTRRYRPTPALAQLAAGVLGTDSITTAGQKVLESMTARTGLTSRLAVLDDGYVVALLRVDGPGPVQLSAYLGRRELPHCSGVGSAFYDRDNAAGGAISVSGLKPGRDEADLHRLGAIVSAHAARLSKDLGANLPAPDAHK